MICYGIFSVLLVSILGPSLILAIKDNSMIRVIEFSHPLNLEHQSEILGLGNEVVLSGKLALVRNESSLSRIFSKFGFIKSPVPLFNNTIRSITKRIPEVSASFQVSGKMRPFESRFPIFPVVTQRWSKRSPPPPPMSIPESEVTFGKYVIKDPLFVNQWFLWNRDNPGYDVNVIPVWKMGIFGAGVTVLIIDDGILSTHKDIAAAFNANSSWDFNDNKPLPLPQKSQVLIQVLL